MSIEEMIAALEASKRSDSSVMTYEMSEAIIAALRAGQAMRDAMFDETKSDIDAADAWDAATRWDV